MQELELYYRTTCPYCRKVLTYMNEYGIQLPLMNVSDEKLREKLIRLGGKSQVPCLVIDGRALYESDEIINWLKGNLRA